jgi:hypothetical protein
METRSLHASKFSFNLSWVIVILIVMIIPFSALNAQDEDYDDPTEVFWGDDEEDDSSEDEYYEDDEFYDDDTSDYYEDDEYYEDDTSDYYEDDEFYEDDTLGFEDGEGDVSDSELADTATRLGYSLNISGASPGFVNHSMNSYNNNPQVNIRLSVEFPLLMQVMGVRFRFGAEVGNFGFENYLPIGGAFSGVTAMGLLAFPAGPGKLKIGAGLIGSSFGVSGESSYGFAIGNTLELRGGIRYTSAFNVTDDKNNEIGLASWVDGLIMLGFNL